jgi:hypothetical protein
VQSRQQCADGRLERQRHLVAGHLDRHAGRAERPVQAAEVRAGPHEHCHVGPRHVVVQVGLTQQQRHVLDLGSGRHERAHLDIAGVVDPRHERAQLFV